MLESKLMQKVGLVTTKLAGKFFALEQDSRIPTIGELAHECETSNGTVQTALSILQEEKAIELLSRGQLGTTITKIDRIKLLEIAGFKTMVGVMLPDGVAMHEKLMPYLLADGFAGYELVECDLNGIEDRAVAECKLKSALQKADVVLTYEGPIDVFGRGETIPRMAQRVVPQWPAKTRKQNKYPANALLPQKAGGTPKPRPIGTKNKYKVPHSVVGHHTQQGCPAQKV